MEIIYVNQIWQLADVYEVRKKTSVEGQQIPKQMEFDEMYGRQYDYVLIEEDQKPVATCRIHLTSPSTGKIERVAVIPECQRKGYGRHLIKAAEKWLQEKGIDDIVITSQEPAVNFYKALGYRADYGKKIESPIPVVYMEKSLKK